jgi:acyl carrier protein
MDQLNRLQEVFRSVFRDKDLHVSVSTSAKDISSWDSLTHLELIAAVEEEFGVKFSFDEVMQFNSIGDMLLLIGKKTS